MTLLETAHLLRGTYQTACIPVTPQKTPLFPWAKYASQLPSDAELSTWFTNGQSIAILAGRIQCLDVDIKNATPELWTQFLDRLDEARLTPLIERLVIQTTRSHGYHMLFRCPAELRNVKLASAPSGKPILETRGTGGYFLVAPSPGYKVIQGSLDAIPEITQDERDDLFAIATTFDHKPKLRDAGPAPAGPRTDGELSPGDDFDARANLPALLEGHGWTRVDPDGKHWRRPGKDTGISASWNIVPGRFWCWSTSTPFESSKGYRPWHVFAVLECNGDFTEAARTLGKMGYGSPARAPGSAKAVPETVRAFQDLVPAPVTAEQLRVRPGRLETFEDLDAEKPPTPPELLAGLIRLGEKVVLGGASKAYKSWAGLNLAVATQGGIVWLERATLRGRVLIVNLELPRWCIWRRLEAVAAAMGTTIGKRITIWQLRGIRITADTIRHHIAELKMDDLTLVLVDPFYKLLAGKDENSAGDVGELLYPLGAICEDTGAALVVPAHFAKGNASAKDPMDRVSGSGVFARDPDSLLTLTKHETDGAFVLDSQLRTFPPCDPFVVRYTHPLFVLDHELDPQALKQAGGRPKTHDAKRLLRFIRNTTQEEPISVNAWATRAKIPRTTLCDYTDDFRARGWIASVGEGTACRQYLTSAGKAFLADQ